MLIYHGGVQEIVTPDVNKSRRKLDFGKGFYTTVLKEQAEKWAENRSAKSEYPGVVSVFEYSEENNLYFKSFDGYSREWLEFVVANRRGDIPPVDFGYDIIEGNIADDNVFNTISNFIEEMKLHGVTKELLALTLQQLSYQKENQQFCFRTEKSLATLKFLESYEV
jgi:hypothetical protein